MGLCLSRSRQRGGGLCYQNQNGHEPHCETSRPRRSFRPNAPRVCAVSSSTTRRLLNTRAGVVRRTGAAEFLDIRTSCRKFVLTFARYRRRHRHKHDTKDYKTCKDKGQGHRGKRGDGLPTNPLHRHRALRRIRTAVPCSFFFFLFSSRVTLQCV